MGGALPNQRARNHCSRPCTLLPLSTTAFLHSSPHSTPRRTMMMTGMQPCSVASSMRALQPSPGITRQKTEEASSWLYSP